jgi:hypothetical protein
MLPGTPSGSHTGVTHMKAIVSLKLAAFGMAASITLSGAATAGPPHGKGNGGGGNGPGNGGFKHQGPMGGGIKVGPQIGNGGFQKVGPQIGNGGMQKVGPQIGNGPQKVGPQIGKGPQIDPGFGNGKGPQIGKGPQKIDPGFGKGKGPQIDPGFGNGKGPQIGKGPQKFDPGFGKGKGPQFKSNGPNYAHKPWLQKPHHGNHTIFCKTPINHNYCHQYGVKKHFGFCYHGYDHNHWYCNKWSNVHNCWFYYDYGCSNWYYWCEPDLCYYPCSYLPYKSYCYTAPVIVQPAPVYVQPAPVVVVPEPVVVAAPAVTTTTVTTTGAVAANVGPAIPAGGPAAPVNLPPLPGE